MMHVLASVGRVAEANGLDPSPFRHGLQRACLEHAGTVNSASAQLKRGIDASAEIIRAQEQGGGNAALVLQEPQEVVVTNYEMARVGWSLTSFKLTRATAS
jgi:hypothetical protein